MLVPRARGPKFCCLPGYTLVVSWKQDSDLGTSRWVAGIPRGASPTDLTEVFTREDGKSGCSQDIYTGRVCSCDNWARYQSFELSARGAHRELPEEPPAAQRGGSPHRRGMGQGGRGCAAPSGPGHPGRLPHPHPNAGSRGPRLPARTPPRPGWRACPGAPAPGGARAGFPSQGAPGPGPRSRGRTALDTPGRPGTLPGSDPAGEETRAPHGDTHERTPAAGGTRQRLLKARAERERGPGAPSSSLFRANGKANAGVRRPRTPGSPVPGPRLPPARPGRACALSAAEGRGALAPPLAPPPGAAGAVRGRASPHSQRQARQS